MFFFSGDGQTFSFSDMGLPGARCQPSDEPITMTLGSKRLWMDLGKATASIEAYTCQLVNLSPIPFFFCQSCYLKGVKMLIRRLRWGARLSTTLSTTSLTQPPRAYVRRDPIGHCIPWQLDPPFNGVPLAKRGRSKEESKITVYF